MKIVAIKERANGNERVGSMWLETAIFEPDTPVSKITEWGNGYDGKLILTVAQAAEIRKDGE